MVIRRSPDEIRNRLRGARRDGGAIRILVDGRAATRNIDRTKTGGPQKWSTVGGPSLHLSSGRHVLRLAIVTGGVNINWFELVPRSRDCGGS